MNGKIRLGIIGAGNMGTAHLKNIRGGSCPDIEVAAVADADPRRLDAVREHISGETALFDDAEKMLGSGKIDAALIAVAHYGHPGLAIACFERGINVMLEKPAGVYTKQVKEMNEAAKKSGVVFGIMFNQRTDCIYRKMRALVRDGGLGAIRRTNWIITDWYRPQAYYDSGAWRATWAGEGGGVLLNQCPHNLDLWQWICGMPKTVSAHMRFGKWHDIEVEDDVTAYVEYENGASGVFITSTGDAPGTNRFEITMDGGKLIAENGKLTLCRLEKPEPEFNKTNKDPFGSPEYKREEIETDGSSEQHTGVLNAFADAILRDGELVARGEEGINSLAISNAMHLSAWTGETVTLPFDDELYYNKLTEFVKGSRIKNPAAGILADTSGTYGGKG